jgi:DNA excision repair protein ERCC-2
MDIFPYVLRKNQKNIIHDIENNIDAGNNFVFESGTGSGKTICALSSALQYALGHNKKII